MAPYDDQGNKPHSEWVSWLNDAISELEKDSLLRSLRPVRVASQVLSHYDEEEEVETSSRRCPGLPMRKAESIFGHPDGVLRSGQSASEQRQVPHSHRSRGSEGCASSSTHRKENVGEDETRQAYDSSHLVMNTDRMLLTSSSSLSANPSPVTVQITDTTREAWLNNTPSVGQEDLPEAVSHASSAGGSCNKPRKRRLHRVKLFSGNDYLGLSAHPDISRASSKECLLFPTGFASNLAVITSLCSRSPSAAKRKGDADASTQRTLVGERSPCSPISTAASLSSSALFPASFSSSSSAVLSSQRPSLSSAALPQSFRVSSHRKAENSTFGRTGDNDRQCIGRRIASPRKGIRDGPDEQGGCAKAASDETWANDTTRREEERRDRVAVFSDALNHASIIDGIRLAEKQSGAVVNVYRHNDMQHLDQLLSKCEQKRKLVLTDSLFSMDGDFALLRQLVELKRKHGFLLVIDEVVSKWKQWILSRGRSYIFSTALPIPTVAAGIEALSVSEREPWRRRAVHDRVEQFSDAIGIRFASPICPLVVGSEESALIAARLRITFSAAHTPRDIQALVTALPGWVISNARRFVQPLPFSSDMLLTQRSVPRKLSDLASNASSEGVASKVVVQSTDCGSPDPPRNGEDTEELSGSMDAGLAASGNATGKDAGGHSQELSKRELVERKRTEHEEQVKNKKDLSSSRARL
ncbi:hypothetical protein CBR_g51950 [Chara braunii]|uniref:Aminotransferase class I/classII large domain-containing protein n=1 Tax=Chara braunii TaxID=69332 RepID=A0A388K6H0_CHABU|nr:hypothetical protein CBR_g51950 [Chara braunii]|eukprot:GBG65650.1 hypothetical protein CBR_g51950 [Chara braunii]